MFVSSFPKIAAHKHYKNNNNTIFVFVRLVSLLVIDTPLRNSRNKTIRQT